MRGRGVWEDHVELEVVLGDVVADDGDGLVARSGRDGGERDVDDIVTHPAAVGPTTRDASGHVASNESEAGEPGLSGEGDRSGGGRDAEDIGDEDGFKIGSSCGFELGGVDKVDESREFGVGGVGRELSIIRRDQRIEAVFVRDRDEGFVEERVPESVDLDPFTGGLDVISGHADGGLLTADGRVDADS